MMKLGQCYHDDQKHVFVIEEKGVYIFERQKVSSMLALLADCKAGVQLSDVVTQYMQDGYAYKVAETEDEFLSSDRILCKPVDPPEAWAVGVTYRRQAIEHDKDLKEKQGKTDDLYTYVYANERAEVFFKGLSRTIVGPNEKLWLRADSNLVMPEAELVLVIGDAGTAVAFTLGNDLTAWDIESECPLYLNQAKIWQGSGSIGPYIVPVECTQGAYSFDLNCLVTRNGKIVVDSSGSTAGLKRTIEELCYFMNFSNKVDLGTVLYTGTTCVIDHNFALQKGDIVDVFSPIIGCLRNEIIVHNFPDKNYSIREGDV